MVKWLVVYSFQGRNGSGAGRIFGTTPELLVTEETILEWERLIRETNGFSSVFITNFQPLAPSTN